MIFDSNERRKRSNGIHFSSEDKNNLKMTIFNSKIPST